MDFPALSRQKVLLSLLKLAARPVERLEFMKWAFLLRQELPSEGGSAFYDFVPYHYGPYSFTLNHEAGKLESEGLLIATETTWTARKGDWVYFSGIGSFTRSFCLDPQVQVHACQSIGGPGLRKVCGVHGSQQVTQAGGAIHGGAGCLHCRLRRTQR